MSGLRFEVEKGGHGLIGSLLAIWCAAGLTAEEKGTSFLFGEIQQKCSNLKVSAFNCINLIFLENFAVVSVAGEEQKRSLR